MTWATANCTDPEVHRKTMNDGTADNIGEHGGGRWAWENI
jgi:hypothetical protein